MSRTDPKLIAECGERMKAKVWALAAKNKSMPDPVAVRYVLEAAIRRVFQSSRAGDFGMTTSLKGGSLMYLSEGVDAIHGRGTKDIDIQITDWAGTMDEFADAMREVLSTIPEIDDGVRFDIEGLKVTAHREEGVPGGSVMCWAQLAGTRIRFKADVGFYSKDLEDTLVEVDYPAMLPGMPPIRIRRQPIEYSISDKAHAAWKRNDNTRMRDYYDLWVYLTKCSVDDDRLAEAFRRSWPMYGAEPPSSVDEIDGYSDDWAEDNASRFAAVRSEGRWAVPTPELPEIVALIRGRIAPALQRIADETEAPDPSHLRDAAADAGAFHPSLQ